MLNKETKRQRERDEVIRQFKKEVVKSYKEGKCLGELCRQYQLDISSILRILQKQRFRKRKLYEIFENQDSRNEHRKTDLILERDKYFLEKFFPVSNVAFSTSYYWFWKEKYNKAQAKKAVCEHNVRHVRCGICNKILKDASNIQLEPPVKITKLEYVESEETVGEKI